MRFDRNGQSRCGTILGMVQADFFCANSSRACTCLLPCCADKKLRHASRSISDRRSPVWMKRICVPRLLSWRHSMNAFLSPSVIDSSRITRAGFTEKTRGIARPKLSAWIVRYPAHWRVSQRNLERKTFSSRETKSTTRLMATPRQCEGFM